MALGYKFEKDRHIHTLDGRPLMGVTTVLKNWGDPSALVNWSANTAVDYIESQVEIGHFNVASGIGSIEFKGAFNEILTEARTAHLKKRDKAGDKGTEIHAQLEVMMNDLIAGELKEYVPIVNKIKNWLLDNGIKPLKSEMNVYSRSLWYGGIADGVVEKDGMKYILDFKTSGSIQTKAFYQCGAYSYAVREMVAFDDNRYPDGVVIVHIPKGASFDPEKNVYWRYDIGQLENAFVSILEAYKLDKNIQELLERNYKKTSIKI